MQTAGLPTIQRKHLPLGTPSRLSHLLRPLTWHLPLRYPQCEFPTWFRARSQGCGLGRCFNWRIEIMVGLLIGCYGEVWDFCLWFGAVLYGCWAWSFARSGLCERYTGYCVEDQAKGFPDAEGLRLLEGLIAKCWNPEYESMEAVVQSIDTERSQYIHQDTTWRTYDIYVLCPHWFTETSSNQEGAKTTWRAYFLVMNFTRSCNTWERIQNLVRQEAQT